MITYGTKGMVSIYEYSYLMSYNIVAILARNLHRTPDLSLISEVSNGFCS